MTDKIKVVRSIKAGHPHIKKIQEKYPDLQCVRYYKNMDTGETWKAVVIEIKIEKDEI